MSEYGHARISLNIFGKGGGIILFGGIEGDEGRGGDAYFTDLINYRVVIRAGWKNTFSKMFSYVFDMESISMLLIKPKFKYVEPIL